MHVSGSNTANVLCVHKDPEADCEPRIDMVTMWTQVEALHQRGDYEYRIYSFLYKILRRYCTAVGLFVDLSSWSGR